MRLIYNIFLAFTLASLLLVACEPMEEDAPNIGAAPKAENLSFTITQGEDDFTFVFTNTSSVTGIAKWDFGNGQSGSGDEIAVKFVTADTYTVSMSLYSKGGSASTSQEHVTTKTDYSIFTDEKYINISGGIDATEGKTWVVDSVTSGHFGIGPIGGTSPEWWSANPLAKPSSGAYDDEFVFKIQGFAFEMKNNGDNYIKDYQKDNSFYTNQVALYGEPDLRVNYTPSSATWSLVTKDDGDYIILSSATPAFFGFDFGGNYEYRIEELTENLIHVSTIGGDGNRWFNRLIPKGYTKPTVTYTIASTETAAENTWSVSLADVDIPEGITVNGFLVDFGDGSEVVEVDDYMGAAEHTYMRKGVYPLTVTVKASNEDVIRSTNITVENYHSNYVPFLLDMMVMYVDNSEVELSPVLGENCAVTVAENPERIYPNKGVNVFKYSKENQPWANAFMKLPAGYRFNLTTNSIFKIMVRGKAGQQVLLKLENTDRGGNAWQTGTADLIYTIQADDTWEVAEFDFAEVSAGFDWTGDQFTDDVTTDPLFNSSFYNVVRIMLNPGVGEGVHEFYFDDLAGPHVEGLKSARL